MVHSFENFPRSLREKSKHGEDDRVASDCLQGFEGEATLIPNPNRRKP